jgi:hypothetical protein
VAVLRSVSVKKNIRRSLTAERRASRGMEGGEEEERERERGGENEKKKKFLFIAVHLRIADSTGVAIFEGPVY